MFYSAYGLSLRSALPLPELAAGGRAADACIILGNVAGPPPDTAGGCFRATSGETHLSWKGVGAFLVRGGKEIVVDPAPTVEKRVLRLFVLGPALAVLLHQRGQLVLHASAVAIAGKAAAFLGGSGWGKSTTAATMHARGHPIVADDVTAVRTDTERLTVSPGLRQLKLWPDAVASLGEDPQTLSRLHPDLEKRVRPISQDFASAPLPLGCIYVLAEGEFNRIDPLPPQDALVELVRHSYVSRLLQGAEAPSHFLQCSSVVKTVPIRRLRRPRSLQALSDLARLVEENVAQSTEQSLSISRQS